MGDVHTDDDGVAARLDLDLGVPAPGALVVPDALAAGPQADLASPSTRAWCRAPRHRPPRICSISATCSCPASSATWWRCPSPRPRRRPAPHRAQRDVPVAVPADGPTGDVRVARLRTSLDPLAVVTCPT
ncbi:MAG: hypothetical protein R3F59_34170 [Myxococcota bacterium]